MFVVQSLKLHFYQAKIYFTFPWGKLTKQTTNCYLFHRDNLNIKDIWLHINPIFQVDACIDVNRPHSFDFFMIVYFFRKSASAIDKFSTDCSRIRICTCSHVDDDTHTHKQSHGQSIIYIHSRHCIVIVICKVKGIEKLECDSLIVCVCVSG